MHGNFWQFWSSPGQLNPRYRLPARVRRILTSFAMPHRACPVCRVQGRLLEDTSKGALVEYYRCDKCGRIWTHRKADPNSPPTLVTVKAKTPDQSS